MTDSQFPESGYSRYQKAIKRRSKTTYELNKLIPYPTADNGDNAAHPDTYPMAFTKGLAHKSNGIIENPEHFKTFENALTQPGPDGETRPEFDVPQATTQYFVDKDDEPLKKRVWESPLAGMAYENQGPDPDMVSIAPAPKLGESELCAEMLEVYAMALVRDIPFSELSQADTHLVHYDADRNPEEFKINEQPATVGDLISILNTLNWFKSPEAVTTSLGESGEFTEHERRRQNARGEGSPPVTVNSLFRGSSPGCDVGPYISQFLLQGTGRKGPGGNAFDPKSGVVQFGAQSISQKIYSNRKGVDWMTCWNEWLAVQDGANVGNFDVADNCSKFIQTPRDLATYVHVDQLYQAYFVACLSLLNAGVAGDPGFPEPNHPENSTRDPFATFGGPHVLSQVTEVASRALRAVRRQKFQVHRRARPERLGAMVTLAANNIDALGSAKPKMQSMLDELGLGDEEKEVKQILSWIDELNTRQSMRERPYKMRDDITVDFAPDAGKNFLLPMAFPEGSPMHPAYGAGHATVAGACTTVLKAFFNIYDDVSEDLSSAQTIQPFTPKTLKDAKIEHVFEANKTDGDCLVELSCATGLTIEGELNKLAANISIGRNFAGVHFYSDYYDSLRLGERVAIGILKEHLDAHPEPVTMHLRGFDRENIYLTGKGKHEAGDAGLSEVLIWDANGERMNFLDWWNRDVSEFPRRPNTFGNALV